MGYLGSLLGSGLAYSGAKYFGAPDSVTDVAKNIGSSLGGLLPFKKGGRVKHKKGHAMHAGVGRKKKAFRKGGMVEEQGYAMGGISRINPAPNHAGYTVMPLPSRIKLM